MLIVVWWYWDIGRVVYAITHGYDTAKDPAYLLPLSRLSYLFRRSRLLLVSLVSRLSSLSLSPTPYSLLPAFLRSSPFISSSPLLLLLWNDWGTGLLDWLLPAWRLLPCTMSSGNPTRSETNPFYYYYW